MKARLMVWLAVMTFVGTASPARAQFFYLDTNGDGLSSLANSTLPRDVLDLSTTSIDVYVSTDRNPDGTTVTCSDSENVLTINSYEALLTYTGDGTVAYRSWTNNMPGFTVNLTGGPGGVTTGGHDVWVGLGTSTALPPGLYKIGTLAVTVTGAPTLTWVVSSGLNPAAEAAFGSLCEGVNFNNTYTLGIDFTNALGTEQPMPGLALATTWGKIETLYR